MNQPPKLLRSAYREFLRHGYYAVPRTLRPLIQARFFYYQGRKIIKQTITPQALVSRWNRSIRQREVDAYFVSFPKCGRTWLSLLLAKAIQLQFPHIPERKLINLHDLYFYHPDIPFIWRTHDLWDEVDGVIDRGFDDLSSLVETKVDRYRGNRVLFLVRHPLDVFVSYYHNRRYRLRDYDGDLEEMVYDHREGIDNIILFYNLWGEVLEQLERTRVVRYEDLHESPRQTLRNTLTFLDVEPPDRENLDQAVEFASFENMRTMEEEDYFLTDTLRAADRDQDDSYKTRKGEVGGHDDSLTPEHQQHLAQRCEQYLDYFDYDLHKNSPDS